jgi:hypothetical protein
VGSRLNLGSKIHAECTFHFDANELLFGADMSPCEGQHAESRGFFIPARLQT